MGVTWLKWLPTGMEVKTRVTSKSNKVNSQKLGVQTQGSDTNKWWFHWNHHRLHDYFIKIRLTSFSYDSVTEGCISVKCQLLTVNFVGFGCQPGFRLHISRQSIEPSYTQIQVLLVLFLSFALASQPFWLGSCPVEVYETSNLRLKTLRATLLEGAMQHFELLFAQVKELNNCWKCTLPVRANLLNPSSLSL